MTEKLQQHNLQRSPSLCTRVLLYRPRVIQKCWKVEEKGGGRMRKYPYDAGYDQDGPFIPGYCGQVTPPY